MNLAKILGLGLIAAGTLFSISAQAAIITATWRGTIGENEGSIQNIQTQEQTALASQSVEMTFVFDTAAVSAADVYSNAYYDEYVGTSSPGLFISATISLGGGVSYALTTPNAQSILLFGDQTKYYKDLYYTGGAGGDYNAQMVAYFFSYTGANITTLNPGQTFTHYLTETDVSLRNFSFIIGDLQYYDYAYFDANYGYYQGTPWTSLTVTSSEDVPAPAALALLGFGLAGLGALRRRKTPTV